MSNITTTPRRRPSYGNARSWLGLLIPSSGDHSDSDDHDTQMQQAAQTWAHTEAMLGNYGDAGWNFLECNVGDKGPVKLCALNPSKDLMCHLYLEYEEKESFVLSVSGNSSIHLSGYYISSPNGDHGHCSDKLATKSASPTCLETENQGDEVDGKTHAPPKEPITSEAGSKDDASPKEPMVNEVVMKNNASPKGPIVSEADGKNNASPKGPIVSEADVKNDASPKGPIVSEADGKNDASPKEYMVSEVDVRNDATPKESVVNDDAYPKEPIVGEADDKNDASPKESIVSEDGNYHDEDLPICASSAKRQAAEKRKSKMSRKDHVLSDQILDMGQLNDKKDSKIMESNVVHTLPTQDQELTHEGNVQSSADATNRGIGQTDSPSIDEFIVFTGATELQDAEKRNEDAEQCGSVHAGKGPINKITLTDGLTVEDLDMGKAKGKIASAGRKVTVKYVCKLMDGQTVNPMDGNNSCNFKLGAGEVIPGLDLGVSGMRIGGKRKLTIPPALGYGDKGEGEIPANSWLIYEVELTKVKRYKKASDQVSVTPC